MNHPIFKKIQSNYNSFKNELVEPEKDSGQVSISPANFKESLSTNNTMIEENSSTQPPDESLKKVLTTEERLTMQLSLEQQKTFVLTVEKLTVLQQSKRLVIQNYELRIKQLNDEIGFITEQIKQNQEILKEMKGGHKKLVETLTDKYVLKSDWKFDTETGEIV